MSSPQEFAKPSKKENRSKLPDLGDFQVQRSSPDGATAKRDKKYTYFDLVSLRKYSIFIDPVCTQRSLLLVSLLHMRRAFFARAEHDRGHIGLGLYTIFHTDLWRIHIPAY